MIQKLRLYLSGATIPAALLSALTLVAQEQAPRKEQGSVPVKFPAGLWMPGVFSNHMVLQRQMPIPVWGRAAAGETVTVNLANKSQSTHADTNGEWQLKLPAFEVGGPYEMSVTSGSERKLFSDVLVGEVWVASGQSNMKWSFAPGHGVIGGEEELARADAPRVRFFSPPVPNVPKDQGEMGAEWQVCSRETLLGKGYRANPAPPSAVAYYFARELERELNVPVGIYSASVGNTRVEMWMPDASLGMGMIRPLVPYSMRGWIWYQGESSLLYGNTVEEYAEAQKRLIQSWRGLWGQGDFPFYFVQLPPYRYSYKQPQWLTRESLPRFQEAQAAALALPNTGMAVISDLINPADLQDTKQIADIHTRNKRDVGHRLACLALANTYGAKSRAGAGPMLKTIQHEGSAIRVTFSNAPGGLTTRDGKAPDCFAIAGADGSFVPATARIEGESVLVSSPDVPKPVAVRFAWDERAQPNLANKEGLVAGSFRTDKESSVKLGRLRCDGVSQPLGIQTGQPRLSWDLNSGRQSAYQVLVEGIWDSGKVTSSQSVNVVYSGPALAPATRYRWKVRVWDEAGNASAWSQPALFTTGLDQWQAKWIGSSAEAASIVLHREIECKPKPQRALVFVCGLGDFELSINGAKVGSDLLPTAWTKFNRTCLYNTYDVTALLREGRNTVDLLLGNGMYNVVGGRYAKFKGSFGPLQAIAQFHLDFGRGRTEILSTDEQWQASPGPITFSCIYGGEDWDARWQPQWTPATLLSGPGGELKGASFAAPPLQAFEVLKPVSVKATIYDLGQNASLMPRLKISGPAGSTVKVRGAELLTADGKLDDVACGGKSFSVYTLAGKGVESWMPKFFYRGCRYLEVECSGGAKVMEVDAVVVHSSAKPVGEFSCSNDLFNRIHTLVRWAQRSNMVSILTDCPHREKLGWLEQCHLNGPALRYNFDLSTLFAKMMTDMADSQLEDGLVPNIAPEVRIGKNEMRDSPEWGSAVVLVPWQQYLFHGDTELFRRHYETMARYVAYLGTKAQDHIIDYGLGDWFDLGPKRPGPAQLTPKALTATAIYYEDVTVMVKAASLLGKNQDVQKYQELAERIKKAFQKRFTPLPVSQTGMAMPLVVGLVEPAQRQATVDALVADVQSKGLTAGDVGFRYLLRALADHGRSDVIYAFNNQSEKPGYGYQLKKGATSLSEAWDAMRGASQNHFMFGQITEWFYHDLAGIQCDPEEPGFKKIVIQPAIVGDLSWVKASYESDYGVIASRWERKGEELVLEVSIPGNTTALIHVPGKVTQAGACQLLKTENGVSVFAAGPGEHRFAAHFR